MNKNYLTDDYLETFHASYVLALFHVRHKKFGLMEMILWFFIELFLILLSLFSAGTFLSLDLGMLILHLLLDL